MPSFSEYWLRNISKAVAIFIKHFEPPESDKHYAISTAGTHMNLGQYIIPSTLNNFDDLVKLGLNIAKIRKYLKKLQFVVSGTNHKQPEDLVIGGMHPKQRTRSSEQSVSPDEKKKQNGCLSTPLFIWNDIIRGFKFYWQQIHEMYFISS
jgi:hypothetical protein